ncbi:porin [Singulisphaera sp. PoT]|uniref:porin n=1 Tax=Singulisphaera sp. PoT TaxID=3411797 RepID=UPI003BF56799
MCCWALTVVAPAFGQHPATPPPSPAPSQPTNVKSDAVLKEVLERLQSMERRLDRVTRQNEELARENQKLGAQVQDLSRQLAIPTLPAIEGTSPAPDKPAWVESPTSTGSEADPKDARPMTAGGGSKADGGDPTVTGRAQEVGNRHRGKFPLKGYYDFEDDGINWATEDDEFTLGIRALTQVEARVYQQPNQSPVSSGIYNPRTRIYFEGRLTKPIQYEFSFQNTFDTLNLLDAYVHFNYDPRFQIRFGRYKTPFTYEWYRIHVWHLLAPERSLYANNYEGNRRFGLMAMGNLFEQRLEYAVGTFNTQRNSYQAFDGRQDVMAFLNFKPFYDREEGFFLRDLNFGGSVDAGKENQAAVPEVLRTNSAPSAMGETTSSGVNAATLPFLAFNPNVRELGMRALWELHAAYYYKGLTLLGAWQSGHESYALGGTGRPTRIPINGWYAQAGYILTGETIRDRTLIDPLRPFDLRRGKFGLGAFELTARYSMLHLDRKVFSAGLADPDLWTNQVGMTDVGFNWYLNKYIKIYFDWEHAAFGSPIYYRPGPLRQITSDLFWLRSQVYF